MAKHPSDVVRDARDLPVFILDDTLIDQHAAQIGAYGVAVYVALARFAKQAHEVVLAHQTIADLLCISRTKVRETLKALEKAKIIRIEHQTDDQGNPIASNRYTLLPIGDTNAKSAQGGVSPHDTGGYRHTTPPLSPHDTPPIATRHRGGHVTIGGVSPHVYMDDSILDIESVPPPPTTKGGGGGKKRSKEQPTEAEIWLIDQGMYPANAHEFRNCDLNAIQKAYKKARDSGSGNGSIVEMWRISPPRPAPPANGHSPPPRSERTDPNESMRKLIALREGKHADP